ncbi:hypothetical protein ACFPN1_01950 [Lysobacter yangpyeongensis]|uniref:Uncharacterized protein n=1 Tax=Lysobacter yangpyeongensis TaxID=346182 RepID=A0ABW0SIZ4_9GAMM
MTTGWNLGELRNHVERLFGQWQRDALNPCLKTIVERRDFARFHYSEAARLLSEAIGDREQFEMVGVMTGAYDKEPGDFEWARFQASAHVSACVHSMHSLADIAGHMVYLAFGMNRDPTKELSEKELTVYRVRDRLESHSIRALLNELLEHPNFAYLSALNNHSKHRSIVSMPYSVDMTGKDPEGHGMKFAEFLYDGKPHGPRWAKPFLKQEYERQEGLILAIGETLNAELSNRRG